MNQHRKLQLIQTRILEDIDKICAENNLKYYMIGGTLLGAVRHKGFIPWDDDIDLVMYREDYDKFIKIVQDDHHEKYFIQTFYTDPHYARYIAKVRLNNTVLIESSLEHVKSHQGIYVDIFPLDHTKHSQGFGLWLRGLIVRLCFSYKTVKHGVKKGGLKAFFAKLLKVFTYLFPERWINRLFDYVCTKDNGKECKFTTNFASHFKWKTQMFENEVFGDGCYLDFEGYKFRAPFEYEKILKRLYGENYMQLPPKEKQQTHNLIHLELGKYDFELKD